METPQGTQTTDPNPKGSNLWRNLFIVLAVVVLAWYFWPKLNTNQTNNQTQNPVQTETQKQAETQKQPETYVAPETPVSANGVTISGATTTVADGIVKSIPNFKANQAVYYACGEDNEYGESSGNGYMNNGKRGVWDLYKLTYDQTTGKWSITQPVSGSELPLMGTLVQIDEVNGATKKRWLPLGPFLGSNVLYENQGGPNQRVAFCGRGYQPELVAGKVIPLAYDGQGKPYPNLPTAKK